MVQSSHQFLNVLAWWVSNGHLIAPSEISKKILSEFLDKVASTPVWKKSIRDDQACLLALSCATFRSIPEKLKKYLFYAQEIIFHARWMTKANEYLRILLFDTFFWTLHKLKLGKVFVSLSLMCIHQCSFPSTLIQVQ